MKKIFDNIIPNVIVNKFISCFRDFGKNYFSRETTPYAKFSNIQTKLISYMSKTLQPTIYILIILHNFL